jgi:hypothetical protein
LLVVSPEVSKGDVKKLGKDGGAVVDVEVVFNTDSRL